MPRFNYVAMDAHGKETTGELEVANQNEAINRIRDMGYFPTSIVEVVKGKDGKAVPTAKAPKAKGGKGKGMQMNISIRLPGIGGVKTKNLAIFTRQLATLIDAGLPLLRSLRTLVKQEKHPTLNRTISNLADAVEGGSTFSEGLSQYPRIFNKLYVNMVRAGEIGGVLEVVLNRLAMFMEKAQKLKNKVMAAMFYPAIVFFIAGAILTFLMVYIVPKFAEIFKGLEVGKMPELTLFVIGVSDFMRKKFIVGIIGIACIIILFKLFKSTKKGKYIIDVVALHMPIIGPLTRKIGVSRFTRTLGTLVSSGVPILQALNIVKETAGNEVIALAIGQVHDSVKEGESIAQPLEQSKVFPPMVISMIDVGEETGALPDMLLKIADIYDDEVDNAVSGLTSLIEPIMIVFLAVIVGTIVIAMFLPLIKIVTMLTGPGGGSGGE